MLYYALVFLVVGVIAGALNLAGVSAVAVQILDSVPDRDPVGRDPCDHRALRSCGVTGAVWMSDRLLA